MLALFFCPVRIRKQFRDHFFQRRVFDADVEDRLRGKDVAQNFGDAVRGTRILICGISSDRTSPKRSMFSGGLPFASSREMTLWRLKRSMMPESEPS